MTGWEKSPNAVHQVRIRQAFLRKVPDEPSPVVDDVSKCCRPFGRRCAQCRQKEQYPSEVETHLREKAAATGAINCIFHIKRRRRAGRPGLPPIRAPDACVEAMDLRKMSRPCLLTSSGTPSKIYIRLIQTGTVDRANRTTNLGKHSESTVGRLLLFGLGIARTMLDGPIRAFYLCQLRKRRCRSQKYCSN
jgi:hypothetical protein